MRRGVSIVCVSLAASAAWLISANAEEGSAMKPVVASYRSAQPLLPISFEYPKEWKVEPSSGTMETYAQVQIYGPATVEHRLRTYLVIRVIPPKAQGGRYAGLNEMVETYRQSALPHLRVEQERHVVALGSPARQFEIVGTLQLPWWSKGSEPVPVKGRRIFFERNGSLYELGWLATPEASPTVEEAFAHLLLTLTFH